VSFRSDLGSGMDGRPDLGLGRMIDSQSDLGSRRLDLWPPVRSDQIWRAWVSRQEIQPDLRSGRA
jgi:hypothetical protein